MCNFRYLYLIISLNTLIHNFIVFFSKQTPTERLSKQVKKLWQERDFRNLTIESLEKGESSEKKESKADDKATNLSVMKNTIKDAVA